MVARSCVMWMGLAVWVACTQAGAEERRLTFEADVRPILKEHCFQCHGESPKPKSGLDLRLVRTMLDGGLTGEAIVPGDLEGSFLWHRIAEDDMPPGDVKLSDEQKAIIGAWIDEGAHVTRAEPEEIPPPGTMLVTEEDRAFWSFQPIQRSEVPEVTNGSQVRTPIDAFLLDQLEAEGLSFAPEADKRTLIRRASFDLLGLPPTPGEVADFLADVRPDAYERMIDRLLASPHYGERWARHWMDVAGYADSEGYTLNDPERLWAYKYRDYLIRSLNADRPWNELIVEQLAGDELVGPPYEDLSDEDSERLVATGFLRMAPDGTADREVDQALARNDVVADTVHIVSTALLGLTVSCAQCHAHRYDPISHEDYYRFRALFEPGLDPSNWRLPNQRVISLWTETDREQAAKVQEQVNQITSERTAELEALVEITLEKELEVAPEELRSKLRAARDTSKGERTDEQNELLKAYPRVLVTAGNVSLYDAKAHREIMSKYAEPIAKAQAKRPSENAIRALTEVPGEVPTTHLFDRGDHNQPRQEVEPGELAILTFAGGDPAIPENASDLPTTGRRLAYARHLTSGRHPLVARVLVNRVWLHHFGRGLVATPGNFGLLGERPSHPALLDWLADEFMSEGWTLKNLHRLLMTSTAYRQVSRRQPTHDAIDPENRLLGRMHIQRLEAESVRDALLRVSGRLNPEPFGPAVPVAPDDVGQIVVGTDNRDSAGRPTGSDQSIGAAAARRTLYVQMRRTMPLSLLESFDPPDTTPNCAQRSNSTVAPQSLMLLNNAFVIEQSEALADRVTRDAGPDPAELVRLAWSAALATEPTESQVADALAFIEGQRAEFEATADPESSDPQRQALASFCHALLCSNAFLYVD